VDEAGHGWEPEIIASFSSMLVVGTDKCNNQQQQQQQQGTVLRSQLVLAGDPRQLGPIVRSDAVDEDHGGLAISLLERLLGTHSSYGFDPQAYPDSSGFDPRVITMLRHCYRCHPSILQVPNELFYGSKLIPSALSAVTDNMLTWEVLPTPGFPMIFHGVVGKNEREGNSPSWFNAIEVEAVFGYVRQLVDGAGVPAKDIAVIAPYIKQVSKTRQLLRRPDNQHRYDDVAVGSCEKMQGQERRVIIITTVRSSTEFLEQDEVYNIGFLSNPKRFNVALTRAQALVIVVGNPYVLCTDPHWNALLQHCIRNKGYRGPSLAPPEDPGNFEGGDTGNNLVGDLNNLHLGTEAKDEEDWEQVNAY
jgi:superfamily I DNA and/or RNA helicase